MSTLGEAILVFCVIVVVGIYAGEHVTCVHIPYIYSNCTIK